MNKSDSRKPPILAMDLEGVLVPEVWIAVADRSGINDLRLTTRDLPDYDRLMRNRIRILHEHRLALRDIQEVIGALEPYPGALEFLGWARSKIPVVILSDTYYEFAAPIMKKLGHPALFCNTLELDEGGVFPGTGSDSRTGSGGPYVRSVNSVSGPWRWETPTTTRGCCSRRTSGCSSVPRRTSGWSSPS